MTDKSNSLILCATTRLAQALRAAHDRVQAAQGARQWPTLDTCTVTQWFDRLVEAVVLRGNAAGTALSARALDACQEQLLWEQVISDSIPDFASGFFDIAGMAATAAEANALMLVWRIAPSSSYASDETREFLRWQRQFRERCAARGLVEAARLHENLLDLIAQGKAPLPGAVFFAGFDRITPQEERLKEILRRQGVAVSEWVFPEAAANIEVRQLPDQEAECRAVARWAAAHLNARPSARLGIVAPDLAGTRDFLEAALDDALHPLAIRPSRAEAARSYNFSLGKPLTDQPLVGIALRLIELAGKAMPVEQEALGELLRHPCWSASVSEADARSLLEVDMRQRLESVTTVSRLLSLARRFHKQRSGGLARLIAHLEILETSPRRARAPARPSHWAQAFKKLLREAGWPGERTLSSHEFQARQAFFAELARLGALDALLGEITATEAHRRLVRLCAAHIFQAQTLGAPRLQVVGMLEAAGIAFDAVWVMGMNDHVWPPLPRPNPLLPAELQRKAGAPNASAQVQLAFATAIHLRLLQSAPDIIFSWPRMNGAIELRPSPLLKDLPLSCAPEVVEDIPEAAAWDTPQYDLWAPPVGEGEHLHGGTGLLGAQAICPAWGYYRYRLGAKALETPVEGLAAKDRGNIAHAALQAFWSATATSAALAAMSESQKRAAMETAVDAALAGYDEESRFEPLKPEFHALERERLLRLLDGWLDVELQRESPFAVVSCEEDAPVEIEGIRFNMRIDRIDQLEDGRRVVIDYKTGASVDCSSWAKARITEPQLPIYAAIVRPDGESVAAVAFAKVQLDEPRFAGIAQDDNLLPGVSGLDGKDGRKLFPEQGFADWRAVLDHWRAGILAITHEIKAGDASVRFSDEKDLQYCGVLPLLRLAERKAQWEEFLREQESEG